MRFRQEVVSNLKDKLSIPTEPMPKPLSTHDPNQLLEAERDIRVRLGDRSLDFDSLLAISNIYRAANAVRNRMEREVLGPVGLTWGGFTILFVLWVWGDRETAQLAEDASLAKGTLSGMLTTLEKAGHVTRHRHGSDGRRVVVHLEDAGRDLIEDVFPVFNGHESMFTERLQDDERLELARLLRIVTATADDRRLVTGDSDDG